ncbi:MAG: ABC transporter substrate-binding protein [bacterium]|nr:ABC transporter substrate-binding protein [bacterium]
MTRFFWAMKKWSGVFGICLLSLGCFLGSISLSKASHDIRALDFSHYPHVNPEAPKGGDVNFSVPGSFDSLNPFILKGTAAAGATYLHESLFYATLLTVDPDDFLVRYPYVASTVTIDPENRFVIFTIRPEAKFQDGTPIRAEDLVFSFYKLLEEGLPIFKSYYNEVEKVEALDPLTVKFTFKEGAAKELPMIVGEVPILSKAYYSKIDFKETWLTPPLGSGPYRIKDVDPGDSIIYERLQDWWAKDLPIFRGRYNFGEIQYKYYRDAGITFEAFKAGDHDFRREHKAQNWALGYNFAAAKKGDVNRLDLPHNRVQGMQSFVFNTRRFIFKDLRVRKALAPLFNFEWANKNLFYGAYHRTLSFFDNSALAAVGVPKGREFEILNQYKDQLPPEVFTKPFTLPIYKNQRDLRQVLTQSKALLEEAGWDVVDGVLMHLETKTPLKFEVLLFDATMEKVIHNFARNLEYLGVQVSVHRVESSQYARRFEHFDFDMIVGIFPQSPSPGTEQSNFWGSKASKTPGTYNLAGVEDPIVDSLIETLIDASTRAEVVACTKALDRVLLWGAYVVPHWHSKQDKIAYWATRLALPKKPSPKWGPDIYSWWSKEAVSG